jgi:nitrite reductase/ring-hydroxylating ferredoxin subunit
MNLPAYSNLQYASNAVYYASVGKGIYIFNTGSGYNAFDAAFNQALSSCSTMTLKGINVVCPCDSTEYSLFTGLSQTGLQYPLKQYRVEVNGTNLRVYN